MLQTDRLILRELAQSDFDAVHQYASDPLVTRYTFGYCFNRNWWRRGLGKEAAGALVQFGFERLHAHRLWAHVFAGNAASVRILEGLAFRQEGLALQSLYLRNSWHDILSFAQLRSEWLANQSA